MNQRQREMKMIFIVCLEIGVVFSKHAFSVMINEQEEHYKCWLSTREVMCKHLHHRRHLYEPDTIVLEQLRLKTTNSFFEIYRRRSRKMSNLHADSDATLSGMIPYSNRCF
jgi:hypothetical protein